MAGISSHGQSMQKDTSSPTWLIPPADLNWQANQVDIWRAYLHLPEDSLHRLAMTLSADETQRAANFHFQADRDRFIASHGSLRDILARYLYCEPIQLRFSIGAYGKPALIPASSSLRIEFNLAHSGDFALIAVACERKVGVDVERIRQGISSQVIARQYFSKAEVAELQTLPLEERELAFFLCWTRKEAYIKAQGLGLSLPLESFDVSLRPYAPAILLATRPDSEEAARWTLRNLNVDSGYAGAMASEGSVQTLNLWEWNLKPRY